MRARDNARLMIDSTAPAPHTHRVTLLIALVGILVAGYALWRSDNTRDREDVTRDRVEQLETANAAVRAEFNAAMERDAKSRADLQAQWQQLVDLPRQVKDLAASHEDLRSRTERPQRAWSRAEAIYLVELAQRRLSFDHDTATAIVALESADARLAALRDSSLNAVRERIAKDLQALRAVPDPDRTGIAARLAGIEGQIERLPLKGVLVGQRTPQVEADTHQSIFQRMWRAVTDAFERMISIRRMSVGNSDIVTLEEQALRRQHLLLLAFAAKHAVMRSDQIAYRSTVEEMRAWVARYFGGSPAVAAAERELDALLAIDIAPVLPDVSAAAQMLTRVSPTAATAP
jgi:uroporphyrin-3 C-methyltransferase